MLILPFLPGCISGIKASDAAAQSVRNDSAASYILNTVGFAQYSSLYWNPHSVGFKNARWSISFGDKVAMHLENDASEFGHIACGSWWAPNFRDEKKLPLKNTKSLIVSVDLFLSEVSYDAANAILRMAVASATTISGTSKFTELDFWDSPGAFTLLYPIGSKFYNGSDEYSYKTHQVQAGQWITITNDFLPFIKESWGDLSQASLECIYMVIESDCRGHRSEDNVSLDVRNLVIHVTE
jgi:hypothetical protein